MNPTHDQGIHDQVTSDQATVEKPTYDKIGVRYSAKRQSDPRIAQQILAALSDASSVFNVGAGGGSYEPSDRDVLAVEPSMTMIGQRPANLNPVVRARAEALPLLDDSFDAALAILTIHHWSQLRVGLAELRRVARKRIVILTWDSDVWQKFWLAQEYGESIRAVDLKNAVPMSKVLDALGDCRVEAVPIPHDCIDGFHGAYWRRPHAYLDPAVRAAISTYAVMEFEEYEAEIGRLEADLESGVWAEEHQDLLALEEIDLGYRLVIAELDPTGEKR